MKTAKEFLTDLVDKNEFKTESAFKETVYALKEFAKLHCIEQARVISENVNESSIFYAYSFDNIK